MTYKYHLYELDEVSRLKRDISSDSKDCIISAITAIIAIIYDYVEQPSMMLHRLPNVRTFTATVTETWRQYELETIAGDEKRVFKGKDSARELAKALMSCDSGSRLPSSRRNNLFK
ncbi:unnamed protein product [Onchocerca ochengi]|uniref:Phage protein n=1 Tax=Onchocerca ochengi TaxID=42157 RepID=A0A182EF33_ONCOC|nr:unnamed protein product [Onchocerca ochengi]